jgi:hypothetical protein
VWPDVPAIQGFIQAFTSELQKNGVTVNNAYVAPDATDVLATVLAANPGGQDVTEVNPFSPAQCVADAKALNTLVGSKKPIIAAGSDCLDPSVKAQLGDYPHYIYSTSYPNPLIADPTGKAGTEIWALRKYDATSAAADVEAFYGPQYFGLVMTLKKLVNKIGPTAVSLTSFGRGITSARGSIWGGPPSLKFGVAPNTALGTEATIFYKYLGNARWKYVSSWLNPPPS